MGADTMRLYILFCGPPERDIEWNDEAVEGCYRFLNRIWRFYEARTDVLAKPAAGRIDDASLTPAERELFRKTHQTLTACRRISATIPLQYGHQRAYGAQQHAGAIRRRTRGIRQQAAV
jgi:leucyl-tRNA synthetase